MSALSYEHNRRRERFLHVEHVKKQLALSVLSRINEEVINDPDITEFTAPMLKTDKVALRMLREYPEIVTRRIDAGRVVSLALNETVQPPELTVRLGQRFDHDNAE